GGRDPTGLPGAAGLVVLLPDPVGVADSAGARGTPPHPGPAGRRPRTPRRGALCPRAYLKLSRQVRRRPNPLSAGDCPLQPPAAPYPCRPLWSRPRGGMPRLWRREPMVVGLSGASAAVEPRGRDAGPGAAPPLQPGIRPILDVLGPAVPPGRAPDARAGRGRHCPRGRARVCGLWSRGHDLSGVGAGRAVYRAWTRTGAQGGGHRPDTAGP